MPVSIVTSPDGVKYRVEHPEGATDAEIMARLPMEAEQPVEPEPAPELRPGTLQFGLPGLTPVMDTGYQMPQWLDEALAGMGRRFTEIGTLGTQETPPEVAARLDQSLPALAGGAVADLSSLLAGGSALRGAGLGGSALSAITNPATLGSAVAGGGLYGAATTPDRLSGGLGGAIGGGLGQGITQATGRVIAPAIDDAAREMIDQGITLTPGEALGGFAKRAEDAATSVPLMGDAIKGAQRRSLQQYNKQVIGNALDPIGESIDDAIPAGREAIEAAQNKIASEYDDILTDLPVTMDRQFMSELGTLEEMAKKLPEREYNKFVNEVSEKVLKPFDNPNNMLLGETFKETDSGLRTMYQKLQRSPDPYVNDLGDALRSVHQSLLDLAKRQHPERAARLADADKAYARMSRINEASGYAGAQEGVFTPSMLLRSIKRKTSPNQYAAGRGFGQQKAEAAKGILAQTIPDSGTTTRALINLGTLGGGYVLDPALAGGLLLGAGAYTRPGARLMQGALTSRPAYAGPLRELIEETAPYTGILGTSIGAQQY